MSDLMVLGVLRMPVTPYSDYLTLKQYIDRGRQAADLIEQQQARINELAATVEQMRGALYDIDKDLANRNFLESSSLRDKTNNALLDSPRQNLNAVKREAFISGYVMAVIDCGNPYESREEAEYHANQRYPDKEET